MAKLRRKTIPIPLISASVDGSDPKIGVQWTRVENGVINRLGALSKRRGTAKTSSTTVQDQIEARQIGTLNDQPVLIGNRGVAIARDTDDVSLASEYSSGVDDDLVGTMDVQEIWSRPGVHLDHAVTQTYGVIVTSQEEIFGDYGSGWVVSFDLTSGTVIDAYEIGDLAGQDARIRCVEMDGEIHYYYAKLTGSDRYVYHGRFDTDGAHVAPATTFLWLGTGADDVTFGLCRSGDYIAILYRSFAGNIRLARSTDGAVFTSGIVVSSGTYAPTVEVWSRSPGIVDVAYLADFGGATWSLVVSGWNLATLTQSSSGDTLDSWTQSDYQPDEPTSMAGVGVTRSGTGTTLILSRRYNAAPGLRKYGVIEEYSIAEAGGALSGTLERTLYGCLLSHRPIAYGNNSFIFGVHHRAWFDYVSVTAADVFVWLAAGRDGYRPVAKAAAGRAKWDWGTSIGSKSYTDQPSSIVLDDEGKFSAVGRIVISRNPDQSYVFEPGFWTSRTAVRRYSMDFGFFSGDELQHIEDGGLLYMAGAMPRAFDGYSVFEQGFIAYPAQCRMVTIDTTGRTLQYVATYEHVDRSSGRWQSIPSTVPATYVGQPGDTVEIEVPTLTLTARRGVRIVLWRSVDGSPYQRVTTADNDTTSPYITVTDTAGLSEGESGESLYSNGNLLEYDQPPPYNAAEIYDSRMWIAPVEDLGSRVWYSRRRARYRPHPFNEVLQIECPADGGGIVSMRRLGERLLVSKGDRTFATWGGPGPDDIGSGPNYVHPYPLSVAVGNSVARSAVECEGGVYFRSPDAIWSISSGGQAQPAGERARWYTDNRSITAGAIDPKRTQIAWQTTDSGLIVHDWLRRSWGTWTAHGGLGLVRLTDGLVSLGSDGHVWTSDDGYDDGGSHYGLVVESGWLPIAGLLGQGHLEAILILGQFLEDSDLQISWGYDYRSGWSDPYAIDLGSSLVPFGIGSYFDVDADSVGAMVLRSRPDRSKCTAIRFRIAELEASKADSKGFEISGISAIVWTLPGSHPVDSGRRVP